MNENIKVPPNVAELARRIANRQHPERVIEALYYMARMSSSQLDAFINKAEEIRAARERIAE